MNDLVEGVSMLYSSDTESESSLSPSSTSLAANVTFVRDMHVRIALWHSVAKGGWELPRKDRLTPRELAEEQQLRRLVLESRKFARAEDFDTPSRVVRLLIGVK